MQKATVLILAMLLLLPLATIQDDEGGQENTARRASHRGCSTGNQPCHNRPCCFPRLHRCKDWKCKNRDIFTI
nr:conotoxin Y M6.67 [Conus magus]